MGCTGAREIPVIRDRMEITICTAEKTESGEMEVLPSAHLPSKTLIFKDDRTGSAERKMPGRNMKKYDYDVGGKL